MEAQDEVVGHQGFLTQEEEQQEAPAAVVADAVCDVLCELLELAVHSILYIRDVYPACVFEKCQKYGIPVPIARHASLTNYIADALQQVRYWMEQGSLFNVCVIISDKEGIPVERFVFEVDAIAPHRGRQQPIPREPLEQSLRAVMAKLNIMDSVLTEKSRPLSFAIYSTVSAECNSLLGTPEMPWIQADEYGVDTSHPVHRNQGSEETPKPNTAPGHDTKATEVEGDDDGDISPAEKRPKMQDDAGLVPPPSSPHSIAPPTLEVPLLHPIRTVRAGVFQVAIFAEEAPLDAATHASSGKS